ncbi:calcineurin-like phosphoesterase [Aureococcus anophagefferens]|nr:calcineurin-like phosphoesterase [Aureococcus anophagefferens]
MTTGNCRWGGLQSPCKIADTDRALLDGCIGDTPWWFSVGVLSPGYQGGMPAVFADEETSSRTSSSSTRTARTPRAAPHGFAHDGANARAVDRRGDAGECLEGFVDIDFSIGGISQNNLGGVAGDCKKAGMKGKPACSAPGQVLRFTSVATYRGKVFDLIVSNRSHYEPTTSCNGCNGATKGFGKINVRIGTGVRLRFDFVDPDDGDAPVTLDSFYFTLFDFDTMESGRAEGLCVDDVAHGVTSYFAPSGATAEVNITEQATLCDGATPGHSVRFLATGTGDGCDNPPGPMELGTVSCEACDSHGACPVDQEDRTVTLGLEHRSSELTLDVDSEGSKGNSGRLFYFAGASSMILGCPTMAPTVSPAPTASPTSAYGEQIADCCAHGVAHDGADRQSDERAHGVAHDVADRQSDERAHRHGVAHGIADDRADCQSDGVAHGVAHDGAHDVAHDGAHDVAHGHGVAHGVADARADGLVRAYDYRPHKVADGLADARANGRADGRADGRSHECSYGHFCQSDGHADG